MKPDSRILIVKAGSLGDIILSLPMLRTLRHAYPKAYIGWIVESPFCDILRGNRDLDRLFVVELDGVRRTSASLWRAIRDVRADAFDVVIDLQGWLKSQLFCRLSGARTTVGVMKPNELGFHALRWGVPYRPGAHVADLFLEVAAELGAIEPQVAFEIPISEEDRAHVAAFLARPPFEPGARIAVLQASTTWKNKCWSLNKLAEAGRAIRLTHGLVPVVRWGPGELIEATEVARLLGDAGVLAPPTSITQLAALLERSGLYVGPDTGPMHLASALGVPVVGLFGPSDATKFGPYVGRHRVVRRDLPCSPCGVRTCRYRSNECMASIDVAQVTSAIDALLAK